jgi:hypothetical protein
MILEISEFVNNRAITTKALQGNQHSCWPLSIDMIDRRSMVNTSVCSSSKESHKGEVAYNY